MHFTAQDHRNIHQAAVNAAGNLKTAEAQLILCLQKVDESKTYLHMGYPSLYIYALEELKLSEDQAYVFKAVAQKAALIPELQESILSCEVTVSKAKRVMGVITRENADVWVELLKTQSKRTIEKAVAEESPREAVQEKAKYVSREMMQVTFAMTDENFEKLKHAQNLMSQKLGRAATLEETIIASIGRLIEKEDPVKRAERASVRASKKNTAVEKKERTIEKLGPGRKKPAVVYHSVHLRDKQKCQFERPSGRICGSERWTDVHHVRELAKGGETVEKNLITLCRAHHRLQHQQNTQHH